MSDAARVVVVVNPGCHLCDDAVTVVDRVCSELGAAWRSINLADVEDPALARQWREMVPVVLVDGDVHDIFRVEDSRLRAAFGG